MREYKFRGKATISTEELDEIGFTHDNGWIYGTYIDGYIINGVEEASTDYIAISNWCPVIPETVGQDTGLKDKNGVEIYEGDICRCLDSYGENYYISDIGYSGGAFSVEVGGCNYDYTALGWALENDDINEIEIIGNIHENPELLEVQK